MLRRLYVNNFRSFVDFEFKPNRVNLILGKNGSGKSTLLQAMASIVRLAIGESPQSVLPPQTLTWWKKAPQTFELEIDDRLTKKRFLYRLSVDHPERGAPLISHERLLLGDEELFRLETGKVMLAGLKDPIPFEGKQSVLSLGLGANSAVARFQSAVMGLLIFKLNPWALDVSSDTEDSVLQTSGSNLVSYLRQVSMSDPASFLRWKKQVRAGMPWVDDIQLKQLVPGSSMLVGVKHVDGAQILLSAADFSEGERTLLVLHSILGLMSKATLIALDEPDTFLSPTEVKPVLSQFALSEPDESQLIVITHHPQAIDYLAQYTTWIFERGADGISHVRPLEFDLAKGESATDSVLFELSP